MTTDDSMAHSQHARSVVGLHGAICVECAGHDGLHAASTRWHVRHASTSIRTAGLLRHAEPSNHEPGGHPAAHTRGRMCEVIDERRNMEAQPGADEERR